MRTTTAAVLALCSLAFSRPGDARQCAGYTMSDRAEVETTALMLNGMGIREATVFGVDVYVAGLYLENPSRDAQEILRSEQVKHLKLDLVRDVSRQEMLEALQEGFERNAGTALPALRDRMRRLGTWIPDLQEGDTVAFTWLPARGLQVLVDGEVAGTIEGADFARAFYAIWLGDEPPNEGLRRGLLGGDCG